MHCNLHLIHFAISSLVKPSGAMIIGSVVMMTPTIQFIFINDCYLIDLVYALHANASSAYIVFVKIETDGFYPFDFLFMSLKISDWNADHFFGGERAQKSPRGEGWDGVIWSSVYSLVCGLQCYH